MTGNEKVLDARLALDDVVVARGVPKRDCRTCPQFDANPDGLGFGWCKAFEQYVKLYHPAGEWHSQCQFKNLRVARTLHSP